MSPTSILTPHTSNGPDDPLIVVNMFKPLVGKLPVDGGITTRSLWPEEDATTTVDEVNASLVDEY